MKTRKDLDKNTTYWLNQSLKWTDNEWNEEYGLVTTPRDKKDAGKEKGISVRDSIWYAAGLFIRQNKGDVDKALKIIETIMTYQFDEPEAVYHGTFYRSPKEEAPPENPTEWKDYDPNWREFICTVFIIILKEFDELVPDELQQKMKQSILLAAQGARAREVPAEYTNISLMSAYLLDYAGEIHENDEWREYALDLAKKIYELFNRNKTYNEYNSPTYYGVDLFALALWREYGATDDYTSMGAEMEAELWRDIAQFYHAGMKNMCGPYDRSYGMDMTEYIAVVALWIAAALPQEDAPMPDVDQPFDHAGDYHFMPLVALVGTKPPEDVLPHLKEFQGERTLERTIEPNRTATAWLSENLMLGAEDDNIGRRLGYQYHPTTAHWINADGTIGWMRTRSVDMVKATASPHELVLTSDESPMKYQFEISTTGATMMTPNQWKLSGITVDLERDDTPFTTKHKDGNLWVEFEATNPVKLTFTVEE